MWLYRGENIDLRTLKAPEHIYTAFLYFTKTRT